MLRADAQRIVSSKSSSGFVSGVATETRSARVIAKDISPSFRVVRLPSTKGEQAGTSALACRS